MALESFVGNIHLKFYGSTFLCVEAEGLRRVLCFITIKQFIGLKVFTLLKLKSGTIEEE
jgi:hypothetical protein